MRAEVNDKVREKFENNELKDALENLLYDASNLIGHQQQFYGNLDPIIKRTNFTDGDFCKEMMKRKMFDPLGNYLILKKVCPANIMSIDELKEVKAKLIN